MHPFAIVCLHQFRLPEVQENDGFLDVDYTHRLIVLIEYQNLRIHLPVRTVSLNLSAEVPSPSLLSA